MLLQVLPAARRVVQLRHLDGRVLGVATTDAFGRTVLPVPAGGALLDIVGSDAVGVAVVPWQRLVIVQ